MSSANPAEESIPVWARTKNPATRMHMRWWTALPSIPAAKSDLAYRRLKRQFADHTMNTWTEQPDGTVVPGSRGFYIEGREDHLTTAFFEDFALFPTNIWFERILDLLKIKHESAQNLAWSYSFEEVLSHERRPRIADVVFMWRDSFGDAVLVVEAKKPRCNPKTITEKDHPNNAYYLRYAAMANIARRHQALLVDRSDLAKLPWHGDPLDVFTWQDLAELKASSLSDLGLGSILTDTIRGRLDAHHQILDLSSGNAVVPDAIGTAERYHEFQSIPAPHSIVTWLVGSELFFSARNLTHVVPPYSWLLSEPSAADWRRSKEQTTAERGRIIWRLN